MPLHRNQRPIADINVVPYIDVMLVLLVIFMITAPLLTQGIQVSLPQTTAKAIPPQQQLPLVVSVDQLGRFYLNVSDHPREPLSAQQLMTDVAARLSIARQKKEHQEVFVKGDKNVAYGQVVNAMVMLQKAGAAQVGLITQPNQALKSDPTSNSR